MFNVDQSLQEIGLSPTFSDWMNVTKFWIRLEDISVSHWISCWFYFGRDKQEMEILWSKEKQCTIRNDGQLRQNLDALHERTNSVSDFCLKPPGVFEVVNLTLHLNKVTNKTKQTCWWEDFTEERYESELRYELHIVSNDVSFLIIEDVVLETLVPSYAHWIIWFADNFFNWGFAILLVLVQGLLEFFV